jgi:hypothetical protein
MRAKATISALALVLAASAALAGPASAAKTGISLSIQAGSGSFSGFVKSKKSSCHSGRKVTLYRKSGRSVKKVGSDTAQPNQDGSQWKINAKTKGKHYAKVSATKSCKGATSRTVSGPSSD